jgi:hypothetical protein
MPSEVICACTVCIKNFEVRDGRLQPGRSISSSARAEHEARDERAQLAAAAQPRQAGPAQKAQPTSVKPKPAKQASVVWDTGKFLLHLRQQIYRKNVVLFPVIELCCLLVAWLNLHAGVSRTTANIVLKALQFILATTLQLLCVALQSAGFGEIKVPQIHLPKDIRSIYKQGMEPVIDRVACCPTCYSLYPADHPIPETCTYQRSQLAHVCGTALWRDRKTRKGVKRVPTRLFSTQSLDSWLRFFLARPDIEDHLEKSASRNQNRYPQGNAYTMHDIADSPAWASLGNYVRFPYNLVWAVYVDWFNPFSNKIAGMSVIVNTDCVNN